MRKKLSIIFACSLTLGLVGCSSSSSSTSPAPTSGTKEPSKAMDSPSKEKVTLTLLSHYVGETEKQFKTLIDRWNKENPDIQIKLQGVDFGELLPTIMTKQTAGQVADIVHVYTLWGGQMVKSKVLADAPDDVVQDVTANYPAAAVAASSINGKVFGYPTEVQSYGLFYNKRLLKDAGYDNPPKTWDEMLEMAQKIHKKDGSGKTTVQGFGFLRGYAGKVVQPFMGMMATAGGTLLSDDMKNSQLNSDAGKKTIEFYSKIFGKSGISDIGFDSTKGFSAGVVGMTIEAGWWAGSLKTVMKDNYKDVGAAPIPSPDGNTTSSLAYTWAFGVNSKSKNQEAAWKFLKWFNSQPIEDGLTPEGKFLLDAFNMVSSRKTDLETQKLKDKIEQDPITKTFTEILKTAKPEQNPPTGSEIQSILYKQIENMWTDKATPQSVIENANKDIQAKLAD